MNHLTLLAAALAANGKPTLATHGVPLRFGHHELKVTEGLYEGCDEAMCTVWNSAGTGAVALGYVRLWVFVEGVWAPLGTGTDADKGKLNADGAFALGVVDVDKLRHEELVRGFRHADRMYSEIFGLGGAAAPAFNVALRVKG